MHMRMENLDWTLLRAFHATATTGSLSAAARRLGLTQPSLSRQVAALEAQTGLALFDRVGRKLVLTAMGRALLEHAAGMDAGASAFAMAAAAQDVLNAEPVSLSVTDTFAAYILPDILHALRDHAPGLRVRVIVTNNLSDLHRREADIALRHVPPAQLGLRGDELPQASARIYASRDWIARHRMPQVWQDVLHGGLLGLDDPDAFAAYLTQAGLPTRAQDVTICTDSAVTLWAMAQAGLGACAMLDDIAAGFPQMVALMPDWPSIRVPFWCVSHERLYDSPRVRVVRHVLRETLMARAAP
ncbi:MAG: LysR family transcriptional regulator [Roseinatronobacter sp.]